MYILSGIHENQWEKFMGILHICGVLYMTNKMRGQCVALSALGPPGNGKYVVGRNFFLLLLDIINLSQREGK